MDRSQIGLRLILDEVGFNFSNDINYEDVRSIVYFASELEVVPVRYPFWWHYNRGLSSRRLYEDFSIVRKEALTPLDDSDKWSLDDNSRERLNSIKILVSKKRELGFLASVHFLLRSHNEGEITDIFRRYGRNCSYSDVKEAVGTLKEHCLLRN